MSEGRFPHRRFMLLIFTFETEASRDKFEYIFKKYQRLMLHKAYGILQDYSLAEDAASEAFIRIYKNIHKIENPDDKRCAAFIVTIVKNAALTILKKEKSHYTEEYDLEQADSFDLEEDILAKLNSEQIYRVVDGLGEELKSVFLLKYAYDMPHKDIGESLGISENNVTVRLHRAKKKLAEMLKEQGVAPLTTNGSVK